MVKHRRRSDKLHEKFHVQFLSDIDIVYISTRSGQKGVVFDKKKIIGFHSYRVRSMTTSWVASYPDYSSRPRQEYSAL